jgi:hypothetical protein
VGQLVSANAPVPAGGPNLTDGSERAHVWNLVWLMGGLTFAAWVWAKVPQHPMVQEAMRRRKDAAAAATSVPRLPGLQQINAGSFGHAAQHCLRSCFDFSRDELRISKGQLRDAILSLPALNVAGTGLEEVVSELLGLEKEWVRDADPLTERREFEGAMAAAVISARQLTEAQLLSLPQLGGGGEDEWQRSGSSSSSSSSSSSRGLSDGGAPAWCVHSQPLTAALMSLTRNSRLS